MTNHRRFSARVLACAAMLAGTLALACTAADAQTSNDGGNGGMGNMSGMSGMATAQSTSSRGSIFDLVRAAIATAPFHNPDLAAKAGYNVVVADLQHLTCIEQQPDGAMGEHHLDPTSVNLDPDNNPAPDSVDVTHPEALVYAPDGNGHLHLVALEYLVLKSVWERTHTGVPSLFGQTFMFTDAGNRFGLKPYYSLHAWIWKFNPSGTFAMWNPNVHCPT